MRRSAEDAFLLVMSIVIYVFSGLYIVLTLALLFAYWQTRQPGLVLIATTYGSAAALGFALAWVLRLMGLDPVPKFRNRSGDKRAQ